jgi:uncharacterized OB-fold protein
VQARRDEDFFWEGVDRGEFLVQKCLDCGALRHPPSPTCDHCQSARWTAEPLSGRGAIHSWLISRHPSRPDDAPRTMILVDLEEGLRFVSNLIDGENAEIGAKVALEFGEANGTRLPLFRTVGAGRPA